MSSPTVRYFHHAASGTLTYVISDPETSHAAVVDPVLGFSIVSGRTDPAPVDDIVDYLTAENLTLEWILETHAHADHLSGAQLLKDKVGGRVAIGEGIRDVQAHFARVFNLPSSFAPDGSQFDHLFGDGEVFRLGSLACRAIATPGHTSDGLTYVVGDAAFVGDTLFSPVGGTARCDFPGGDAALLFDSIQKILSLPSTTRLFLCHDYPKEGRDLRWETSIDEQRASNIHVGNETDRQTFVERRTTRDAELSLPAMILPAIQVNIRAGALPPADDNGVSYLRIPLDQL